MRHGFQRRRIQDRSPCESSRTTLSLCQSVEKSHVDSAFLSGAVAAYRWYQASVLIFEVDKVGIGVYRISKLARTHSTSAFNLP